MSDGNTLYLECRSGISGDMTVAALLDLGATEEHLRAELQKLPVDGYKLQVKKVVKSGLLVSDFDVILDQEVPAHTHAHDHHHGEEHMHAHHEGAEHSHDHGHDVAHSHDQMPPHVHRSWAGIEKMLLESDLKPRVKALSLQMFRTVAEAEAKVHGRAVDEVHFHEVGAVDSIVDIVGTAICLDELHVDKVLVSELTEGCGHIRCQHGVLPVPVPAVLEIASAHHLSFHQIDQEGEMVTPTGAAIAALAEGRSPEKYVIKKIGMGAGKREYKNTNILRAMLIEEEADDSLWMLESNIDDCAGEELGYTLELLLEAGARDAFFTPIYMKKNRPAYKLSVLCDAARITELEAILFRETTTIGVRRYRVERDILKRRFLETEVPGGTVRVKVCELPDGSEKRYPEYEDVRRIARETGKAYREVYEAAKAAAEQMR